MIPKTEINRILGGYDKKKITVGTIGSHSALNIFKGAKEEGFNTVCVCKKESEIVYKRFPLADQIITVKDYVNLLDDNVQQKLRQENTILVPHGSFNAYVGTDQMIDKLEVPMFGNRELLQNQKGLLVEPEAEKIAKAVDYLLSDSQERFQFAKNAHEYFCSMHRLEIQVQKLACIYLDKLYKKERIYNIADCGTEKIYSEKH